jgi:hypothetical protein
MNLRDPRDRKFWAFWGWCYLLVWGIALAYMLLTRIT